VTVKVKVHQGASINFIDENGKGFFLLYDTDITTYDNGASDDENPDNNADDENEPTLIVNLYTYAAQETVRLEFASLTEKRNFLTILGKFLQFR
jgi:hypothetical protein